MEIRSLHYVASACEGVRTGGLPETPVLRVCTDSRQAEAGDLFFALRGERFDAHEFIPHVAAKVAAVVVERGRLTAPTACARIEVEDTRKALGRLAAEYRRDFTLPLIAVAGSNGKTTTKEIISAVCRQHFNTLWSQGSFNNDVGVPLTLLNLARTHEAAVLEAGTNHPGELESLVRMMAPTCGVITSIGREHLEFFGDLEGVAREEGALAELLPASGKLFINGDSAWAEQIARRARAAVVRVGFNAGNQWRVRSVKPHKQSVTFSVEGPLPEFCGQYQIGLLGRHQAGNALLAICVGAGLGMTRAEVEQGLAECRPASMRLQSWELRGVRVLDDAYNANTDSMRVALETLRDQPCRGRRVAVLGDMAELGAHQETAHQEVGRLAAELGVAQLFAVGRMAPVMADGARRAGLARVLEFADVEAAGAALKKFLKTGDVVLLKASRASRLERVAELLRAGEPGGRN